MSPLGIKFTIKCEIKMNKPGPIKITMLWPRPRTYEVLINQEASYFAQKLIFSQILSHDEIHDLMIEQNKVRRDFDVSISPENLLRVEEISNEEVFINFLEVSTENVTLSDVM